VRFFSKRITLNQALLCAILVLLAAGSWSCRPKEVVVEVPVTRIATAAPAATVVVTVEKTVIVTQKETVQVVVTSTPTPIPTGGYVTRTTFNDAKTLNPVLAADPGSLAFCDLMFEGLLRVDPFTGELKPNFAQGWTVSDDGLSYTFTIRKGLEWSDGQPITAHDFYFTYAALLSGLLDTPNTKQVANIAGLQMIDDYTVAVTFAQADCANLESLQIGWLPMHPFTDDADTYDFSELAIHEFNSTPSVFSGPFMLGEWVRGERWVQVRNDHYWRGAPYLEGIITQVVGGQAEMIDMLESGQADLAVGYDPQYLSAVEMQPELQIFKFLSDGYDFIGFQLGNPEDPQPRLNEDGSLNEAHGQHPTLSDLRVRQAIAYALDRADIVAKARLGQGVPLAANVLPIVSWAYNTDLESRQRDLSKAGELLEDAGWVLNEGTGIRERGGKPLKLRLYTNAGNEVRETMGALIQAQLGEVGIDVELIAVEWNSFLDVLFGQTFDMVLVSWSNLGVNPHDESLWSAQGDVPGRGNNFVSYYDPQLEAKYVQARTAPGCDQDLRAALYRQIQAQLQEDQPYCWIDVPRQLVAINGRVGGVNPGPWSVWHNVHEWYVSR
jgi:peptide/nickel transport system substrate-binding protein